MVRPSQDEVTGLLQAWSDGDETALETLTPIVYGELHRLARHYMAKESPGHVLQTTALINEAYLRLLNWEKASWRNRAQFLGVSARLMRQILVDFARKRRRPDKQSKVYEVTLDDALEVSRERGQDLVAVDDALKVLEDVDSRKSEIVELRFFGGLTVDEVAEVLNVSPITVLREWKKAKAWLLRELSSEERSET